MGVFIFLHGPCIQGSPLYFTHFIQMPRGTAPSSRSTASHYQAINGGLPTLMQGALSPGSTPSSSAQQAPSRKAKRVNVDELDEDPPIPNQKFALVSYLLPDPESNEIQVPMVKLRGVFADADLCERKAKKLQEIDRHFDIIHTEVGKWFGLFPREELMNQDDIQIKYREDVLNQMMGDYKANREQANLNFEQRKKAMIEKARKEGSKEGQEELAGKREEPIALLTRIRNYSLHIEELNEKIEETKALLTAAEHKKETEYKPEEFEGIVAIQPTNELDTAIATPVPEHSPASTLEQIQQRIVELEDEVEKDRST